MPERPYIGVTGPVASQEVGHLVTTFKSNGISLETDHQPMIGFLVSYKTLNGQEVTNRRYPAFRSISSLLEATGLYAFNTIHYNSRELSDLGDQIKAIFTGQLYDDKLCRGLQLNIPWPPIDEIVSAKRALPDLKIIMQLSQRSLEGKSPREVAELLAGYGTLIDYALIDLSGGRAAVFQPEDSLPYYLAAREQLPNLAVGLAGGFTGENVAERCKRIIEVIGTRDFSIDAEGGLRDKVTEQYGDDIYNPEKVESYIKAAGEVLI